MMSTPPDRSSDPAGDDVPEWDLGLPVSVAIADNFPLRPSSFFDLFSGVPRGFREPVGQPRLISSLGAFGCWPGESEVEVLAGSARSLSAEAVEEIGKKNDKDTVDEREGVLPEDGAGDDPEREHRRPPREEDAQQVVCRPAWAPPPFLVVWLAF